MRTETIQSDLEYITNADLPWDVFEDRTVLISGASGFLPTYLVETLLYLNETKDYNVKVIGLVRDLVRARERFAGLGTRNNLQLVRADVCESFEIDEPVHYIIHAASLATPKRFKSDPVGTISPNVIGTHRLLKLAKDKKVTCFLFFSTSGVYGFVDEASYPLREDCFGALNPTNLASCYLESKRMGENMCIAWMHQHEIPVKIVRPAITYGPGVQLNDGRSFADFISNIIQYRDIELYSDGKAIRNFCYIADATLGFFTVLLKGRTGEPYNVATDHEISILDLARQLVEKVFPERGLKVIMRSDHAKNFLRMNFSRTTVDISKARALGWKLSFPIEEGFRRTVKSIEEERGYHSNHRRQENHASRKEEGL